MRLSLAVVLIFGTVLSGCSTSGFLGETVGRAADRVIEAETPEERRTRVAAFAAVIAIIIDVRVKQSDPQASIAAAPRLLRLQGAVARVLSDSVGFWTNVALVEGRFALYAVVGERASDLIVSNVWRAPFVALDLDHLGVAAAQVAFGDAAFADIQNGRDRVKAGAITEAELRAELVAEIDRRAVSVSRIASVL